jgi:hypothetical protein
MMEERRMKRREWFGDVILDVRGWERLWKDW